MVVRASPRRPSVFEWTLGGCEPFCSTRTEARTRIDAPMRRAVIEMAFRSYRPRTKGCTQSGLVYFVHEQFLDRDTGADRRSSVRSAARRTRGDLAGCHLPVVREPDR